MRQKPGTRKSHSEKVAKDIRRATRKQYFAEDKNKVVLDGLRGEDSIADLCRREGIAQPTGTGAIGGSHVDCVFGVCPDKPASQVFGVLKLGRDVDCIENAHRFTELPGHEGQSASRSLRLRLYRQASDKVETLVQILRRRNTPKPAIAAATSGRVAGSGT